MGMERYTLIVAFGGGVALGYFFFYLRYGATKIIDELRKNLKLANEEIDYLNNELEEYTQQNIILKEKTTELLEKNDDLATVVAELSKYYIHIKRASEKSNELNSLLSSPDERIHEKMEKYVQPQEEEKSFF